MKKMFTNLLCRILGSAVVLAFALMTARANPVVWQSGNILVMSNVNVQVQYDLTTGTADFYWQNSKKISSFYAGVQLPSGYVQGNVGYSNRTYSAVGNQVTVTSVNGSQPTMNQYFTFNQNDSFLARVDMVASTSISANWMGPIVMSTAGGVDIGVYNDNRALIVPFDNDAFVSYNAAAMNSSGTGHEVAAFYDNTSRNGLVVGSITHDTWKTGIYFSGSNNKLDTLNVFGGQASPSDNVTNRAQYVVGTTVSSPTMFVGFGTDWRDTMVSFANANVAVVPKKLWTGGVPFGWNSYNAYGSGPTYSNVTACASWIKTNLQNNNFTGGGAGKVYINFDSYWDNMSQQQRSAFPIYCHTNGQLAGIYWATFTWWGTAASGSNYVMQGSSYHFSDAYLRDTNGNPQSLDGAIALDPTHPGMKALAGYFMNYFKSMNYDYVKLDFLSHASLEGRHYDTNVTTGIQAYNIGMQTIVASNNGAMYLSESIAPIFPYQYGHSRRIACDASTDAQYTMNSVTYGGFWQNGILYQHCDPDLMQFSGTGVTVTQNQERMINCAIAGTVFLNSDAVGTDATAAALALAQLTNAAVNAVARSGVCFKPVEANTGTLPCTALTAQIGTVWYLAVFDYGTSTATVTVNFARAGIPSDTSTATDLCAGTTTSVSGSMSVSLSSKQAKLFKLSNGTTPPTPSVPTSLTATTVSSSQINLSWSASSGVSGYNVKRATASGGPYTTVATAVTTAGYLDGVSGPLSASTTYYYVVSAVNDGHESGNSAQASATTQALPIPPAPTGLTAIAGNNQVALTWTGSTLWGGGSAADSYNVKRGTTSGGPYTTIASPTGTSYTDTAAVNGTTYFYVVSAVNTSGESTNSSEVSATPLNTTWVNDTGAGITYSGTWNLSSSRGLGDYQDDVHYTSTLGNYAQYTFTGTGVQYITELDSSEGNVDIYLDGAFQTTVNCANTISRQVQQVVYSAQNLVSGSHTIKIVMNSGTYMLLDAFTYSSAATPPPAPTGLTATAVSSSQINLSWTASSGATSYNVKRATVSGGPYTTIASPTTTSYTDTTAVNGTTYYYVVSAVNSSGESANSSQVSATPTAGSVPTAPTGLTATVPSGRGGRINLSWTASTGATSYNVKQATVSGGPYTTIATGVTTTTYNNSGLTTGTTYYYVVSAVNAAGESPNSNQASATAK
jgi:fibronectin type 3 domain-containing protein